MKLEYLHCLVWLSFCSHVRLSTCSLSGSAKFEHSIVVASGEVQILSSAHWENLLHESSIFVQPCYLWNLDRGLEGKTTGCLVEHFVIQRRKYLIARSSDGTRAYTGQVSHQS